MIVLTFKLLSSKFTSKGLIPIIQKMLLMLGPVSNAEIECGRNY